MMEMVVRYLLVCLVMLGVGYAAYADQPLPAPVGGPISKPPTQVSPQDLETMKLAKCEATNDDLVRELLALRKEIADRDAAAHQARRAKLVDKYMLDQQTVVTEDGAIQRPAPANPPAAPPPSASSKPAATAPPAKKKR